jgi:MFS family permease
MRRKGGSDNRLRIVAALGTTQTLAWASSYYLAAIVADPIARSFGTSTTAVFAAFSVSLLLSALLGPRVGRTIDRLGGREVLAFSNLVFAFGLATLALAQTQWMLWLGWMIVGAAMGMGLYDAAFAALGRIYGDRARSTITGITLIAGFASTVGWPLTAWGVSVIGWRYTCAGWALGHLLIGLPLNLFVLPNPRRAAPDRSFTTDEIAREFGISRNHLTKIFQRLATVGSSSPGGDRGGGFGLARP